MNKSNLLFATLMAGAVSGIASDSFGMVPYAPVRSRNGRAKGHRNGNEKTDDAFTRQNREFKAGVLDQIADNLKLLAQEKKTA